MTHLRISLLLAAAAVLAGSSAPLAAAARASETEPRAEQKHCTLEVVLELESEKALDAKNVQFATFPSGKRCAFTYFGPKQPTTIAFLTKLGFRTTLYLPPHADEKQIKAYEDAGAEISVRPWGMKGSWLSHIGSNTYQEAYDAAVTSRYEMLKRTTHPVLGADCSSSKAGMNFLYRRNPDDHAGFGFVFHDANYLANVGPTEGFNILTGRTGAKPQVFKAKFSNTMESNKVPNEIVYYRIVANWFRGTLERAEKGQVVQYSLRDFKAEDLDQFADIAGEWGKHAQIWHATEGEIAAYEYLKAKAKVLEASAAGASVQLKIGLADDTFAPFLRAPLTLELAPDLPLKSAKCGGVDCTVVRNADGVYVDVPVAQVLRGGCEMTFKTAQPDMTIPAKMDVTLTIKNTAQEPLAEARLAWVGTEGLAVGPAVDAPFTLAPGEEKTFTATLETVTGLAVGGKYGFGGRGGKRVVAEEPPSGARWGLNPIQALLTAKVGSQERTFVAGHEVLVAPKLRIEVDPMQRFPIAKDQTAPVIVRIDNIKKPNHFISQSAGACKGVVTWELPDGLSAEPKEHAFNLAENSEARFLFKLTNSKWSETLDMARPVIRFEGETVPVGTVFPGVLIARDTEMQYQPLDELGMTLYASWDHPKDYQNNRADRAVNKSNEKGMQGQYGGEYNFHNDGVKGWCLNSELEGFGDPFQTLDYQKGTVSFWVRRDPKRKNENQMRPDREKTWQATYAEGYEPGELLFGCSSCQYMCDDSKSTISLKRFPGWDGKKGYLEAVYAGLTGQRRYVQVDFDWSDEWCHVAMLWDMNAKRLEIYLNGKLAGKAEPGVEEWLGSPWDRGRSESGATGVSFSFGSKDHGKVALTLRDELYIFNQPLAEDQIRANMEKSKQAAGQ